MSAARLMLGNEAIAYGLIENGCRIATSYPGTPASEILGSLAAIQPEHAPDMHVQWAINEKVALEIAYAGSITGLRTAVSMKQVGLNVASDPLMSAAYLGTRGGFLVISADDPGPHSSQTEQDSRLMAMMAKIPVLDPGSPQQAKEMVAIGYDLSEAFSIPVMLRPTTRICHARQDVLPKPVTTGATEPTFEKDPARWAATPKFRLKLHHELQAKMAQIAAYAPSAPVWLNPDARGDQALVVSGVAAAHAQEIVKALGLWDQLPVYQVRQPFPLHQGFGDELLATYQQVLVIEETAPVMEMQLADRNKVQGKLNGVAPQVGELLPEKIEALIGGFANVTVPTVEIPKAMGRRPTLCAGCPHRASFFAIKKAAPRGIYTSDIGCYTLGLNLGAVDTVLCMGAAISQAAGFYQAFKAEPKRPDIVATIGDSTFFHAGLPALLDAVVQGVKFVLVILDNRTTAMTGNQPTPASGRGATGEPVNVVDIETLVHSCGVGFCKTADPYDMSAFVPLVREAVRYSRDQGPAVVIARHPCLIDKYRPQAAPGTIEVEITDDCDGCGYCTQHFECPALVLNQDETAVTLDRMLCTRCGVCLVVCPKKAIRETS